MEPRDNAARTTECAALTPSDKSAHSGFSDIPSLWCCLLFQAEQPQVCDTAMTPRRLAGFGALRQ